MTSISKNKNKKEIINNRMVRSYKNSKGDKKNNLNFSTNSNNNLICEGKYKKINITNSNKPRSNRTNTSNTVNKKKHKNTSAYMKNINTDTDLLNKKTTITNNDNNDLSINKTNANKIFIYQKINKRKICNNTNNNSTAKQINKVSKTLRCKTTENKNKISTRSVNELSTFKKRKKYIVPEVKTRRKKIEENSKKNEEVFENSEIKQLFISQLIENKQNEFLRDYQKYMTDCNDKIIKNN